MRKRTRTRWHLAARSTLPARCVERCSSSSITQSGSLISRSLSGFCRGGSSRFTTGACTRRRKTTPLARFAGFTPRYPTPAELREAFLWAETRLVTKTATVSLLGNRYEVDQALCGRRVELRFDPYDLELIEVYYAGRPCGHAVRM